MSSGNIYERILRQLSTVLKLTVDEKRNPQRVSEALQRIIDFADASLTVRESEAIAVPQPDVLVAAATSAKAAEEKAESSAESPLDIPIGKLSLSYRTLKRLFGRGLKVLGNIVVLKEQDVQQLCSLSDQELAEVKSELSRHNLHFDMTFDAVTTRHYSIYLYSLWGQGPGRRHDDRRIPTHSSVPRSESSYHGGRFYGGEW